MGEGRASRTIARLHDARTPCTEKGAARSKRDNYRSVRGRRARHGRRIKRATSRRESGGNDRGESAEMLRDGAAPSPADNGRNRPSRRRREMVSNRRNRRPTPMGLPRASPRGGAAAWPNKASAPRCPYPNRKRPSRADCHRRRTGKLPRPGGRGRPEHQVTARPRPPR